MIRWFGRLLCAFNFHRASKEADRRFIWSCLRCTELQAPQIRPLPKAPRYSSSPLAYNSAPVDPLRLEPASNVVLVDHTASSVVSFNLNPDVLASLHAAPYEPPLPEVSPPEPYEPTSDFGGGDSSGNGSSGEW